MKRMVQENNDGIALGSEGNILLSIKGIYDAMTPAERLVADYVLQNPKEACSLTITDLAEVCKVGYTSVFRFCKTLKLKGYTDFKIRLTMALGDAQKGEIGFLPTKIAMDDSVETAAEKLMRCHTNAIVETKELLNVDDMNKAADFIAKSKQLRFFGVAGSMLSAMDGMYKFLHIRSDVFCLADSHMQLMSASTMTSQDAGVFLSHAGENKDIVAIARQTKATGAKTIGITQHIKSPMTEYMDVVLPCGGFDTPFNDSTSRSTIPQLYMLDLLFTLVYYRTYDQSRQSSIMVANSVAHSNY